MTKTLATLAYALRRMRELGDVPLTARMLADAIDPPAEFWVGPFEWRGENKSPLPPSTTLDATCRTDITTADDIAWWGKFTFRYRSPDPAGWLPRGDWIPPAELWAPECPVRCEWINATVDSSAVQREQMTPSTWSFATHIRLIARQPQAGLPEGWKRTRHGDLVSPSGRTIFVRENVDQYGGGDVIRQAVDAWLREMGDE